MKTFREKEIQILRWEERIIVKRFVPESTHLVFVPKGKAMDDPENFATFLTNPELVELIRTLVEALGAHTEMEYDG